MAGTARRRLPGLRPARAPAQASAPSAAQGTPQEGADNGDDLLARYRDGDAEAFQALFDAYGEKLVQFFFRLCWDRHRAEDFTQELFLRLLRRAATYRPQGRLSTFIFRVATNLWIDHYRATRPMPRLYSLDQPLLDARAENPTSVGNEARDRAAGPLAAVIGDEEKACLRAALDALNEPHRLVLELAVYQELPYGEISSILNIPVGTVKSRMFNTVRVLKDRLQVLDDGQRRAAGFRAAAGGA
jgi:RNA polymerase sigma-70 factor (ECF subfamily)